MVVRRSGFGLARAYERPVGRSRCSLHGVKSLSLREMGDGDGEEWDLLRGMKECFLLDGWSTSIQSVLGILEEFNSERDPQQER